MMSRTIDEFRRRAGMDGWTYHLWAVVLMVTCALLAWVTFRDGIAPILADPLYFLVWTISLASVVTFWRARPKGRAR